jgi:ComF family protein
MKFSDKENSSEQGKWEHNDMKELLVNAKRALISALFPVKCLVCGSFYHTGVDGTDSTDASNSPDSDSFPHNKDIGFDKLIAPCICSACSGDYLPIKAPICIQCGIMFQSREDKDHTCEDCIRTPKKFKSARAAGIYDRSFMEIIHSLKYKGRIQLAKPLGQLLLSVLFQYWAENEFDLILPVPLHSKRLKKRGFNQAFLLIRNWSDIEDKLNINVSSITIDPHVLKRHKSTKPQTGLKRRERMKNIKNAFSISDPDRIKEKKILLVDDVYTTGATVNECASVLLKNGAGQVDVLTLARAM